MNHRVSLLVLLALSSPFAAAESYPVCVVRALGRARAATPCQFERIVQMQIVNANRDCRPVLMNMALQPGADLKQISAGIPALRVEADGRAEILFAEELRACGLSGEIKIGNGGSNLSVTIVKSNDEKAQRTGM